jgi:hypothetical protein
MIKNKEIEEIKKKLSSRFLDGSTKNELEKNLAELEKSVAGSVDLYESIEGEQNKNPQKEYLEGDKKDFPLNGEEDAKNLKKLCVECGIKHTKNGSGEITAVILPKGCSSETLRKALDGDKEAMEKLEEACKQEEYQNQANSFIEKLTNKKQDQKTGESWVEKMEKESPTKSGEQSR